MLTINEYAITLTQGDSATINFNFSGDLPGTADRVVMQVRSKIADETPVLSKVLTRADQDTYTLTLVPADTKDLRADTYLWDVRVYYSDGTVITPVRPSKFQILDVVTRYQGV